MKEREMKMEEFDIRNVYIDIEDLDHMIFPKVEEFDSKEVREAFKKFVNYTISRISS